MKKAFFAVAGGLSLVAGAFGADVARVARWEGGEREKVLEWFRSEWFGHAPVGRPADEKIGERSLTCGNGEIRINFHLSLPDGADKDNPVPVFVFGDHFNKETSRTHTDVFPGIPTNSITGRGYAYVCVNLNDAALNVYDERWSNRVHRVFGGGKPDSWGTLGAWAWCFSRTVDWIETRPELDAKRIAILGFSRGGKAALWAGAQDERIALTIPHNSGTGGARLLKYEDLHWDLEHIREMKEYKIGFWFCPNFLKYDGREAAMPHDADDLMRLVAPRLLYVGSSSRDYSAGPRGEFGAAKRASELWEAYGLKGISVLDFPPENSCLHDGQVAYHLKDGKHSLVAWDWDRYLDYADKHLKDRRYEEMSTVGGNYLKSGGYEPQVPKLAKGVGAVGGFDGRSVDVYTRIDGGNAVGETREKKIALTAWRNERVHGQVTVWSDMALRQLRLKTGALTDANGRTIPASCVRGRFVRHVLASDAITETHGVHYALSPDCLDTVESLDLTARGYRSAWYTVAVPEDAAPGIYRGQFAVVAAGGKRVEFPVELTVLKRSLPAAKDRQFYLDIWQHPLGVARYHGVRPFSPEHYALLEPLYRELAAAGQKAVTAPITDFPWGGDGGSMAYGGEYALTPIRSLVKYIKKADGTYAADFSLFDEYVAFCRKCGIGPQIHCYTIVKFAKREMFQYIDEASGDLVHVRLPTGSAEWKAYVAPLLRLVAQHLREKGWFEDSYIALDEVAPEMSRIARDFVSEIVPDFKFAEASNIHPRNYSDISIDNYSQILWHDLETKETFVPDEFLASVKARKAAGKITTFYVCPEPQHPNSWLKSPLVESEWIGIYSAAKEFSGFLRWAGFSWPRDPFCEVSAGPFPSGENHLLYPGALASTRWELLRDGFEDWEKIRLIRESGRMEPGLKEILDGLDFSVMETADEDTYRTSVRKVLQFLNADE